MFKIFATAFSSSNVIKPKLLKKTKEKKESNIRLGGKKVNFRNFKIRIKKLTLWALLSCHKLILSLLFG